MLDIWSTLTGVATTAVGLIAIRLGSRHGATPAVSPLHIFGALLIAGVPAKILFRGVTNSPLFHERLGVPNSLYNEAGLYVAIFGCLFCFGYWLIPLPQRPEQIAVCRKGAAHTSKTHRIRSFAIEATALIATLGVLAAMLSSRGLQIQSASDAASALHELNKTKITASQHDTSFGSSALAKALLVLPLLFMARSWDGLFARRLHHAQVRTALWTAVAVLCIGFQGKRMGILYALAIPIAVLGLSGRRIRPRHAAALFAAAFIGATAFFALTAMRSSKGSFVEMGAQTAQDALSQIFGSTYFLDASIVAITMQAADSIDLGLGESYGRAIYGWIPRSIWPEKPDVAIGRFMKTTIVGWSSTTGGINPTAPGEAFYNFGWWGCGFGLLLGSFVRYAEGMILTSFATRRYSTVLYASILVPFTFSVLQSSFSAALVTHAGQLLLCCGVLYILNPSNTPSTIIKPR